MKKPGRRVWDKTLSNQDLRVYLKKEPPPERKVKLQKAPLETSRLSELTLMVNTGGVYKGDDERGGSEEI